MKMAINSLHERTKESAVKHILNIYLQCGLYHDMNMTVKMKMRMNMKMRKVVFMMMMKMMRIMATIG